MLSKTQNRMFLLQLYQQEAIENYQKFLAKDFKDQFIEINIKQKVRIKIQQTNIYLFSNQILLELIDCLFYFIQMEMEMLKDLMLENIIYQKA